MSEFVEECRREWRRLGVPDAIAGEMAADLATDLAEAEADGVSAEHVLGSGAFDPRSFARAWASERGVIGSTTDAPTVPQAQPQPQPVPSPRPVDRPRLRLADAILLAAIVVTGLAALALLAHRRGVSEAVMPVRFDAQGSPGGAFPVFVDPHRSLAVPAVVLLLAIAGLVVWLRYRSPWADRASGRGSRLDDGVGGPG